MNMPATATKIVEIPIKLLTPSKRNVRKSTPSKESHAELVAGIRAVGVLHPPTVTASNADGLYEVIAGKRRLKALQDLVKEGTYSEDDKIACRMVTADGANLEEISLIENTQRQAMHPADEFEAFTKMKKNGSTPKDIALHLGIAESTVYKRLKLGQVAPAIIKAYRDDKLSIESVMAFTVEDDKLRQLEVFEALKGDGHVSPHRVRQALKGDTETSEGRLGKFVGQKAYEKAGGSFSCDLFKEVTYFNDAELLKKLAMQKLQREADKISGEWNWVEITLDDDNAPTLNRIRAYDTPETAPLIKQYDTIQGLLETLYETDEEWTDKHAEQELRLDAKLEEINQAIEDSRAFRPQEQQLAGCRVSISYGGAMHVEKGLIRKEDEKKLAELQNGKSKKKAANSEDSTNSDDARSTGDAVDEPDGDYSQALTNDLTTYRLNIAKHYLARDTDAVQNLLIYTLCSELFFEAYYSPPINLSMSATNPESSLTQPDTSDALRAFNDRSAGLALGWLNIENEAQRFEAFTALSGSDKFDLMAYCVASALKSSPLNGDGNTVAEIVIRGLDIPWHKEFQPDANNYFGRLSKDHLIEHGKMFLDDEWAAAAAKRSKKQLAEDLEAVFAGKDETMPADKRAAAMDWVPPGFRCANE